MTRQDRGLVRTNTPCVSTLIGRYKTGKPKRQHLRTRILVITLYRKSRAFQQECQTVVNSAGETGVEAGRELGELLEGGRHGW